MAEAFEFNAEATRDEPSEGLIVEGSQMFLAEAYLLRGWTVTEVAEELGVNRKLVSEWISLLREGGSPLPRNMDGRAMRAHRTKLSEGLERVAEFLNSELLGLMDTARAAHRAVDEDLELRREPIEIGSGETEKTVQRRGTLLSPKDAMAVYQTTMDEIHRVGNAVSSYLTAVDAQIEQINAEGHEGVALPPSKAPIVLADDFESRRERLRRKPSPSPRDEPVIEQDDEDEDEPEDRDG